MRDVMDEWHKNELKQLKPHLFVEDAYLGLH